MSRSNRAPSTLSGLIESDSEDATLGALDVTTTPESARENTVPSRRAPKGAKGVNGRVMKARAPARRASGTKAFGEKKGKRAPLLDKTNKQHVASDTEEVDDFEQQDITMENAASGDELDASVIAVKQMKPQTSKAKAGKKIQKGAKDSAIKIHDTDQHESTDPNHVRSQPPMSRSKASHPKQQHYAESKQDYDTVQETQKSAIAIDDYRDEDVEEPTLRPIGQYSVLRAASQTRQVSIPRKRVGSASDTERNEPAIRRRLGEMTRKLENLDIKYRNVREVGIKEAQDNFEKLKKQNEESQKAANELISSLKADLAAQSSQLKESRDLKKLMDVQTAEISKLQAKVAQLTSTLSDAHIENKTLSAKLAANRSISASVESANGRGPGSAVKANGGIRLIGSAEVAQAAQSAQLKEDLYSDLTGLIIRDVKREAEDDVYDCIQTGRNGTLHFKLAVANEKSAESYDDAHCIYIPQLDPSRDKGLMEMLPEYLVDEITFPRPHSAKFYARVVKALTEKQN